LLYDKDPQGAINNWGSILSFYYLGERCLQRVESKLDRISLNVTDIPKLFPTISSVQ
jgi:hypothetical protein